MPLRWPQKSGNFKSALFHKRNSLIRFNRWKRRCPPPASGRRSKRIVNRNCPCNVKEAALPTSASNAVAVRRLTWRVFTMNHPSQLRACLTLERWHPAISAIAPGIFFPQPPENIINNGEIRGGMSAAKPLWLWKSVSTRPPLR